MAANLGKASRPASEKAHACTTAKRRGREPAIRSNISQTNSEHHQRCLHYPPFPFLLSQLRASPMAPWQIGLLKTPGSMGSLFCSPAMSRELRMSHWAWPARCSRRIFTTEERAERVFRVQSKSRPRLFFGQKACRYTRGSGAPESASFNIRRHSQLRVKSSTCHEQDRAHSQTRSCFSSYT